MARSRIVKKSISSATENIFEYVVDYVLFIVFSGIYLSNKNVSRSVFGPSEKAGKLLENINYKTITQSLNHARRKGFIMPVGKGRRVHPAITAMGRKRLDRILPVYETHRYWDQRLYLVTYDIPERSRRDRDLLAEYLKKIGCARIQFSVWITPYNPYGVLQKFIADRGLRGSVLISCIGKDGYLGEEDLQTLLTRVYYLDALNERYEAFLNDCETDKLIKSTFSYLSILRDDPQLPFDVLPKNWLGDEAYRKYLSLQERMKRIK